MHHYIGPNLHESYFKTIYDFGYHISIFTCPCIGFQTINNQVVSCTECVQEMLEAIDLPFKHTNLPFICIPGELSEDDWTNLIEQWEEKAVVL